VSRLESILLYTDIFICIFISLYTCICIHVYTYLLIHTHAYTRRGQGVHAYICIHVHTYTIAKARVEEGECHVSRLESILLLHTYIHLCIIYLYACICIHVSTCLLFKHLHANTGAKARVDEGQYHVSRLESIMTLIESTYKRAISAESLTLGTSVCVYTCICKCTHFTIYSTPMCMYIYTHMYR